MRHDRFRHGESLGHRLLLTSSLIFDRLCGEHRGRLETAVSHILDYGPLESNRRYGIQNFLLRYLLVGGGCREAQNPERRMVRV